mgnify:CR=1 FL=1
MTKCASAHRYSGEGFAGFAALETSQGGQPEEASESPEDSTLSCSAGEEPNSEADQEQQAMDFRASIEATLPPPSAYNGGGGTPGMHPYAGYAGWSAVTAGQNQPGAPGAEQEEYNEPSLAIRADSGSGQRGSAHNGTRQPGGVDHGTTGHYVANEAGRRVSMDYRPAAQPNAPSGKQVPSAPLPPLLGGNRPQYDSSYAFSNDASSAPPTSQFYPGMYDSGAAAQVDSVVQVKTQYPAIGAASPELGPGGQAPTGARPGMPPRSPGKGGAPAPAPAAGPNGRGVSFAQQHQYLPYQPSQQASGKDAQGPAQGTHPNAGKTVHMRRAEAWLRYIAYEGCLQVRPVGLYAGGWGGMHGFGAAASAML